MAHIRKKEREPRPVGFKRKHRTTSPNEKKYQSSLWRDRSRAFLERGGTELLKTKTQTRYVKRCAGYGKNPKCSKAATTVDHIDNASQDHVDFWNERNWRPMCRSCHAIKSNKERGRSHELKQFVNRIKKDRF